MHTTKSIKDIGDTLISNKYLNFYKVMKYPIPQNMECFFFEKKNNTNTRFKEDCWFSRNKKNKYMDEYIEFINKYWNLYKSIPFIKEIYLCNSISFNSLKKDSDIDLFIITQKNSIRRARFFSLLFFSILWIRRWKEVRKKFCLSFYVTEDNQNLYNISIPRSDIYLNYWLAHLITLYQEKGNSWNIYKHNNRFRSSLPNHPQKFCINIGNKKYYWNSKLKNILQKSLWWLLWNIIEYIIKIIWIPILKSKTKKLWKKWQWVIISDQMLKFYHDKRFQIHLMYEINAKTNR